jgi:hypothetical protein
VACIPPSATTSLSGLLVLEPLAPTTTHSSNSNSSGSGGQGGLLADAATPSSPAETAGDDEPQGSPGTPVNARSKQRPRRVHIDRSAAHMGAVAGWLADRLGVVEEVEAEAAAAAAALSPCGWRLHLLAQRSPQQMVQVSQQRGGAESAGLVHGQHCEQAVCGQRWDSVRRMVWCGYLCPLQPSTHLHLMIGVFLYFPLCISCIPMLCCSSHPLGMSSGPMHPLSLPPPHTHPTPSSRLHTPASC